MGETIEDFDMGNYIHKGNKVVENVLRSWKNGVKKEIILGDKGADFREKGIDGTEAHVVYFSDIQENEGNIRDFSKDTNRALTVRNVPIYAVIDVVDIILVVGIGEVSVGTYDSEIDYEEKVEGNLRTVNVKVHSLVLNVVVTIKRVQDRNVGGIRVPTLTIQETLHVVRIS